MKYNFQAANLYFFQSFRYNVTYEEVWETQPGKPSAWVTWRPSDHWKNLTGMVWAHINFIRTFQVTLLEGITWRGRGRRKTSERLSDTLIVSGMPSVALPPRRDIPWKLPERGGGGCTAPPDTDQKCYFSRQFSDQVLESFTCSPQFFLVLLSLHR